MHIPVVCCNVWKSSIQVEKEKRSIYGDERKNEVKERMAVNSGHGQCLQECPTLTARQGDSCYRKSDEHLS